MQHTSWCVLCTYIQLHQLLNIIIHEWLLGWYSPFTIIMKHDLLCTGSLSYHQSINEKTIAVQCKTAILTYAPMHVPF